MATTDGLDLKVSPSAGRTPTKDVLGTRIGHLWPRTRNGAYTLFPLFPGIPPPAEPLRSENLQKPAVSQTEKRRARFAESKIRNSCSSEDRNQKERL